LARNQSSGTAIADCATNDVDDDENDDREESGNIDAADDDSDQKHAQTSSVKSRPAKQTARSLIQSVIKLPRVKGFKSPRIAQYKPKRPDGREWDPVGRKYFYPSKGESAAAADQPPSTRSHKKASATARPASASGAASTVFVPVQSENRSCIERAERVSARAVGVTPKAIIFEDREAAATGDAPSIVASALPAAASAALLAAATASSAAPHKSDKLARKVTVPSARAVGVMPKVILFDGDDEGDTGKQQPEDIMIPAMFAYAHQQLPHPAVSLPTNTESARPKPSSSTPYKRSRSSVVSPPAPAPLTSPRKRGQQSSVPETPLLPAHPPQSFMEDIKQIADSEIAADPRSEAKLKAVAQFLLGGVVERAELADQCARLLCFCIKYLIFAHVFVQCIFRYIIERKKVGSGGYGTCHRGMCLRMLPPSASACNASQSHIPIMIRFCCRHGAVCLREASQAHSWCVASECRSIFPSKQVHQALKQSRESLRCWRKCTEARPAPFTVAILFLFLSFFCCVV
jgi:hypothetical protein